MDFINTSRSGRNEILTEIRSKDSGEKERIESQININGE
jgi:hypothetical protein